MEYINLRAQKSIQKGYKCPFEMQYMQVQFDESREIINE